MAIELGRETGDRLYLGTFQDEPAQGDEPMEALQRAHQSAASVVNDFSAAQREIASDANLSEAGKKAKLASSLAAFEKRLDNSTQVADRYAKQAAESDATITTAAIAAPTTALAEQRAAEIRRYWRESDRAGQTKMLHSALDANDTEILSALLNAPKSMEMLMPPIRQHVLDTLAARHPQHEQVARLKRGSEVALFGLNRARKFLRDRSGITESAADRLRRVEGKS